MLNISNKRECFFDDTMVNNSRTTAEFLLHQPVRKNKVMTFDEPWEKKISVYHCFVEDEGIVRMYYVSAGKDGENNRFICYAESNDGGITWIRPILNICEFDGSTDNNIILDSSMVFNSPLDNFMVFIDSNPSCPTEKKYKALSALKRDGQLGLCYLYSADGIHFIDGGFLTTDGHFDSFNVAFWDDDENLYRCYFRGFHSEGNEDMAEWSEENIRDIRYMESKDFINWSTPELLKFDDDEDVSLYTNNIQKYPRASHILIGFPTRYLYRRSWNGSFEELCGKELRLKKMEKLERLGLTLNDCIFITSRDGLHFKKYNEAFMHPGPETGVNWFYRECNPAYGFLETPSDIDGADNELSIYAHYVASGHDDHPREFIRYTIRCDGFVSMHAGEKEKMLVTKQFTYNGSELFINFETSALGYMYFTLVDENGNRYESCETFGDKIDRRVSFDNGIVKKLSGKPVTLEVRMRDADLYSIMFR